MLASEYRHGPRPTREQSSPDAAERMLIQAAKAGDTNALGTLWLRHEKKLRAAVLAHVRNKTLADDIMQDVFIQAMTHITDFQTESSFHAWIMAIARNKIIDRSRKKSERLTHSLDAINTQREERGEPTVELAASEEHGLGKNTENDLLETESREQLRAAITYLSPVLRDVVELFYFQHTPYKDIAKIIDIPLGTVMSRLNEAKKKLQEVLKRHQHAEFSQRILPQHAALEEAIQHIPNERMRRVIYLSEILKLPQKDIIRRTTYSKGTVQYWIQQWRTEYISPEHAAVAQNKQAAYQEEWQKKIQRLRNPRIRKVMYLTKIEGKTQKEIATMIGLSETQVNHYAQLGKLELATMTAANEAENEQRIAQLKEQIARITPDQLRTILTLKMIEGKTNREIGERLGVSAGTIFNRLQEGQQLLNTLRSAEEIARTEKENREKKERLVRDIAQMPNERTRQLLSLYLLEAKTSEEIGTLFHTAPQNIRRQLQRAQAELRAQQATSTSSHQNQEAA
ncbi:MAG: sigma-70 family RNA polymerase sigma factor [Candidatus Kerfeldbacteria bacterium]|nr:sigma-70 family RNA polymerase sigma factor [Candidatus Kerfeldbacteria bacterium]